MNVELVTNLIMYMQSPNYHMCRDEEQHDEQGSYKTWTGLWTGLWTQRITIPNYKLTCDF